MPTNGRDYDWLLTAQQISGSEVAAYNTMPFASLPSISANTLVVGALAQPPQVNLTGAIESFQTGDSWLLERVVGTLLFTLDHTGEAAPWLGLLSIRIAMFDITPGGTPVIPVGYDLRNAEYANDPYMFQHFEIYRREGSWLEPAGNDAPTRRVEVDIRTKRKVEALKAPVLVMQWEGEDQVDLVPRLSFLTRLRCLGSQRA